MQAKEIAKMEDKWLLVNIQKDSEFQCHALNRFYLFFKNQLFSSVVETDNV